MRREKKFTEGDERWSGITLTVTRKGVEVDGWYDHIVGLVGPDLTWDELLAAKAEVERKGTRHER